MTRIIITSTSHRVATAVLHGLSEVPHSGRKLSVVDWGTEAPADWTEGDRWIALSGPIAEEVLRGFPAGYRVLPLALADADWPLVLNYCGLSGVRCQLDKGLEVFKQETGEQS